MFMDLSVSPPGPNINKRDFRIMKNPSYVEFQSLRDKVSDIRFIWNTKTHAVYGWSSFDAIHCEVCEGLYLNDDDYDDIVTGNIKIGRKTQISISFETDNGWTKEDFLKSPMVKRIIILQ